MRRASCRCNKAKITNKKDFPLKDLLCPQPFQFMRQRGTHGKPQIGRQRDGADGRTIMKLHLAGLVCGSELPPPLQVRNRVDE